MAVIFATWGDPTNWRRVNYQVGSTSIASHSSTIALSHVLGGTARVFLQDTLIFQIKDTKLIEKGRFTRREVGEEVRRHVEDVVMNEWQEARGRPEFFAVPGAISAKREERGYVLHSEEVYNVVVGALVEYVLESLEGEGAEGGGIGSVVVDTTHGINYFAVALVEASRLAATIYLLKNSRELRDVEISRYNSDPFVGAPHGEININLISSERLGGLAASYLAHTIENFVATHGSVLKAASTLHSSWQKIKTGSWETALSAAILFVRGAPTWALRAAREAEVPTRGEVVKRLEETEIECKHEGGRTVCSYSWGSEKPTKDVVVVSELVSALKKLEEGLHDEKARESALKMLEREPQAVREKTRCYDLEELKTIVERVYPRNVVHLFTREVKKLRKIIDGACGDPNAFRRAISDVMCGDVKALRFKPGKVRDLEVELRNLYAHAGLARGLDQIFIELGGRLCHCPLNWGYVVKCVQQDRYGQ